MKKLLLIIVLGLSFCSLVSAKEFVCFQEKKKENTILINVKPMFGLKKSFSNIENKNETKILFKMGDLSGEPFQWAESFFVPDQNVFSTLFFSFYKEGVVSVKNPKLDPYKPYILDYKSDRLKLRISKRKIRDWDMEMFNNPDKEIYFDVCTPK